MPRHPSPTPLPSVVGHPESPGLGDHAEVPPPPPSPPPHRSISSGLWFLSFPFAPLSHSSSAAEIRAGPFRVSFQDTDQTSQDAKAVCASPFLILSLSAAAFSPSSFPPPKKERKRPSCCLQWSASCSGPTPARHSGKGNGAGQGNQQWRCDQASGTGRGGHVAVTA